MIGISRIWLASFDRFVVTGRGHLIVRLDFARGFLVKLGRYGMLSLDRFSLGNFTFRRGQTLVTQLNHRTRFFQNGFSLVQTYVKKFNQVVDRSMGQRVDVSDAMLD